MTSTNEHEQHEHHKYLKILKRLNDKNSFPNASDDKKAEIRDAIYKDSNFRDYIESVLLEERYERTN